LYVYILAVVLEKFADIKGVIRRTDKTVDKRTKTNKQTVVDKTLHRKLKVRLGNTTSLKPGGEPLCLWMEKIALVCSICCNSVYAGFLINNYDIFVIYHLLENVLTVIHTHCGEGAMTY
jgi:hypothetical protein